MKDVPEDGAYSATCYELLDKMGDHHEADVGLGSYRVTAVHVFQSEAAVLEHVKSFVTSKSATSYTFPEDPGDATLFRFDDGLGFNDQLTISGAPDDYGMATPAYGTITGLIDDSFTCSVSAVFTNLDVRGICTGYSIMTNNLESVGADSWGIYQSGTSNSFTYTHSGLQTHLTWEFAPEYLTTVSAAIGGSCNVTSEWLAQGATFSATATPDEGYLFARWVGEVPESVANTTNATITFEVDMPRTIVPVFKFEGNATYHVATYGSDDNDGFTWATPFKTLQAAADNAIDGDLILVTNGIYTTQNLTTPLIDTAKRLTISSVEGPHLTQLDNKLGQTYSATIVKLAGAGTIFDGFTVSRAGRRSIELLAAAVVTNCIVRDQNTENLKINGNLYVAGGVEALITGCQIINNTVNSSGGGAGYGAAIQLDGLYNSSAMTTIENCVITNNYNGGGSGSHGSAIYISNYAKPRIINSLIAANRASYRSAIYTASSLALENCTVAGNYCTGTAGPAGITTVGSAKVTLINTILAANHTMQGEDNYNAIHHVERSCAVPLPGEETVIESTDDEPLFVDAAAGNYRLDACSLVNAGTNLIWTMASGAVDLDGQPRIKDGTVDIGCFEYEAGALSCTFQASDSVALDTCTALFTSSVFGANTNGLYYTWEISGSESATYDGAAYATLHHTFGPGRFNVKLTVTNVDNESASYEREGVLLVVPNTMYVSLHGAHVEPFVSLETAATNIPDAVNIAIDGVTILVDEGLYESSKPIQLLVGATLQSLHGRDETTIRGPDAYDVVHLEHAAGVVRGFTIERRPGYNTARRAVYARYGLVENCVIRNNTTPYGILGTGVYLEGSGTVRNCLIYGNKCTSSGGGLIYGAGIWMNSGLVEQCLITNNWAAGACGVSMAAHGGAVHMTGGTLRNSVVAANRIDCGIGFYASAGRLENVTISDNHIDNMNQQWGECVKIMGSTKVVNTIISGNLTDGVVSNLLYDATTEFSNSYLQTDAAAELADKGNIFGDDPLFVAAPANYALRTVSPCVGGAALLDWMTPAAVDVIGKPRIYGARPDIGAFECQQGIGTLLLLR